MEITKENGFRPYDLEVIPEMIEMNKCTVQTTGLGEHFTISATGVIENNHSLIMPGTMGAHVLVPRLFLGSFSATLHGVHHGTFHGTD